MRGGRLSFPGGRCSDHPGELLLGVLGAICRAERSHSVIPKTQQGVAHWESMPKATLAVSAVGQDSVMSVSRRKYQGLQS